MSGTGVGAKVATGVALAEAKGLGLKLGVTFAIARTGKAIFRLKNTKNNRIDSFRMES